MLSQSRILTVLVIITVLTAAGQVWAGGEKERMRDRLPAIIALKAAGVVGEDNQGFLSIRKQTDQKKMIEAENRDRRAIYQIIAKKQGTSPALVGQRRAMQIAQRADPGTWVQGPKGAWRQK